MIEVTDEMLHAVYEYMDGEYEDDELVKRIIELHEASKWVKFDEHAQSTYPPVLPERYLLRVDDGDDTVIAECICAYVDNELLFARERERYGFIGLVTHWQPLPQFKE